VCTSAAVSVSHCIFCSVFHSCRLTIYHILSNSEFFCSWFMQYRCYYSISFKETVVSDYRIKGGVKWNGHGTFCGRPCSEICLMLLNRQGFETSTPHNKSGATMLCISCQMLVLNESSLKCVCRPAVSTGLVEIWQGNAEGRPQLLPFWTAVKL